MSGASLAERLLFCLYSFLFGGVAASRACLLRSAMAALRLLPSPLVGSERMGNAFRIKKEKAVKGKRRFFVGYFLYDALASVCFFSLYMLFLYAHNGGAFRLYSFLLSLLGLFLLKAPAFRLFSFPLSLVGALFRVLPWAMLRLFKSLFGKGRKKLDESGNMV